MSKNKMVLTGSTILLLILSPRFVVKAEEINSNTIVDMNNQGKPDFLMVDGFPNICTKNIMTAPNSNEPLESEKSKPSASEPNVNQPTESEKSDVTESGSNTNQSVDFDKDNENLNVSNEEIEMPSDNIEGTIIQSIDTNQFVESDNNKDVEENNEISDENGSNLISSVAEDKSSKQKRYDVLKVIPTKNINYDWQLSALNTVILTFIILTGIYGIFILLPMVQTLIWINRKQTLLLNKIGSYKNYE